MIVSLFWTRLFLILERYEWERCSAGSALPPSSSLQGVFLIFPGSTPPGCNGRGRDFSCNSADLGIDSTLEWTMSGFKTDHSGILKGDINPNENINKAGGKPRSKPPQRSSTPRRRAASSLDNTTLLNLSRLHRVPVIPL